MLTRAVRLPPFLAPFAVSGFAGLWVSASGGAFARVVTQLVFSWLTLEATGSPFMVGVVAAARMVPGMLLGIPAGVLADWADRRLLIIAFNAISVVLLVALVPLVVLGLLPPLALVIVSALYGTLDTLRMAATQAYAYDLVRTSRATSGMALTNLGVQLLTTLGGLVGGYTLDRFGSAATFGLIAVALLVAVAGPALGGRPPKAPPPEAVGGTPRRARPDLGKAARLLLRNRLLALLALGVILAEIFGFASQTLLPTFAHDVFDVGAAGLGTMLAVRSGGGALGLLLLAWVGAEGRAGRLFLACMTLIGLMLVLFAEAPSYTIALVFLALVGMSSSVMDTLGQTLMQRNAGETQRGAAMGLWVFSVGFGPIGHLTLGAAASEFGAPPTQVVAGALLAVVGLTMALNRSLRWLR